MAPSAARRATRPPARTPASLGYRMPAEWARHEATWLSWPHDPVTFRDLEEVEGVFATIAATLSRHEHVEVLVPDEAAALRAVALLDARDARDACVHVFPTADVWIRDYGPTFLLRHAGRGPRRAYVRWRFNAWGGKYAGHLRDDGAPDRLGLEDPRFAPPLVMEGGSIDVNGEGSVLVTEQCLLNPNRNPHLLRAEIEAWLRAYLGVRQVLWLGEGIEGDDTDGHVDDLARFTGPRTIVTAWEEDRADGNFAALDDAWRRLTAMADPDGRPFEVVRLPMPGPLRAGKRRLPASYANFYVGNGVVLLPTYGPRARDEKAARILRRCFPGRAVVPVDCRALVYGYGSIHCATQQMPATRRG
jgi:agmatine deiminase